MSARVRTAAASIALATALTLSGCAADTTGITADTSDLLQSSVVVAAEQAAAGDTAGALSALDTLQAQLQQGSAAGDISADRAAAIQAAIDAVRTDLQPAPATDSPVDDPATTEVSTDTPETGDDGGPGNGNKGPGNGDKGNGKGDKGNGKDK
jgi:hypothetical protein